MTMNKNMLIEKINLQKQYANKIAKITVPPLIGIAGLGIYAIVKELKYISENRSVFVSCYLIIILSIAGIMIWLIFRNMRRIGLVCSNCHKLLDKDLQQNALKTLKCGKCGEIIITENSAP